MNHREAQRRGEKEAMHFFLLTLRLCASAV